MTYPHYHAKTIDDIMRDVILDIREFGIEINPTRGAAKEISGVLLELSNPRARLSQTETRGKALSCLGELCWHLAGRKDLEFISYYLSNYVKFAEKGIIYGGYGPRLYNWNGLNQVKYVINCLKEKPDSRKAIIQLFDRIDVVDFHRDVPCTCTLQFIVRNGSLNMFTCMRSNDVFWGLPHDIFFFTMLQEIIARNLTVKLGIV